MGASMRAVDPVGPKLRTKDLLSILDLNPDELQQLVELASRLKQERSLGLRAPTSHALDGRHIGLLFEKPSLRTRVTFTIGVRELGGDMVEIPADVMHADREPILDVVRKLERWVDAVVIRTFGQDRLVQIGDTTKNLHLINALTDEQHPCQALADIQTLREIWGSLAGRTVAFVGDGNNVATSIVHAGVMLGMRMRVATPKGYELPNEVVAQAAHAAAQGADLIQFTDPKKAVEGADAVYTDVWTSMGQEVEYAERKKVFARYQVNEALMARAKSEA
jgi:ornithine carbamoyltransferase